MTKVIQCTCQNEFQDKTYGKGMRVFNEKMAGGKHSGWRCTVCNKEIKD